MHTKPVFSKLEYEAEKVDPGVHRATETGVVQSITRTQDKHVVNPNGMMKSPSTGVRCCVSRVF